MRSANRPSLTVSCASIRTPLAMWTLLLLALLCVGCKPHPKPSPQPVHGYVHAKINSDFAGAVALPSASFAVPDIEVVAKNVTTGTLSTPTSTDPYGYFRTPELAPGNYQICVSGTNFVSSCDAQVFTIGFQTHVMDHIVIIPTKLHAVVGAVKLADKQTPCFWYNPTFDPGFVMTAKVSLEDSSGTVVAGPVRGNNFGDYVMPTTAPAGSYKVNVECEATKTANTISLSAASLRQDFLLSNHPPVANLLVAAKGAVGVRRASPSDALTIKIPSDDLDHDTLHYKWVDESGSTPTSFPDASTVNWTAPTATGLHVLRALVSDGHGGYAISRTTINVGPDEMLFTGTAFNRTTHAAVAAASVNLDGVTTSTDSNGHFQVKVPDTTRFVLNVSKPGFALTSRIFYTRATNIQVPLDPVQTATVDGKTGGKVSIKVVGCKPTAAGNDNGKTFVAESRTNECPKQDIGVLSFAFGPNSLVSGSTPFTGAATVEGFQFDLTLPNAIPGDQSGTYKGKDARLQTFGAFHITPRDAMGNALQMAPGKTVEVSMPIHPLALATAPAKIPFFSYDEHSGFWVEHGELTRVGNNYVGKIKHFSEFNADSAVSGSTSCLRIQLEQDPQNPTGPDGFPLSVVLNASYVNTSVGNFNHPDVAIGDTSQPIVIERLIPNQDFNLTITDSTNTLIKTVLLNSGPPVSVPFPVPFPYDDCSKAVVFKNNSVPPSSDYFLLSGTITDAFSHATDYKTATTTGTKYGSRDTLSGWLNANGFVGGATESHAIYFNNGDLKFGRNMHCRNVSHTGSGFTQDWIACYVSNFGLVGQNFTDQPYNPLNDPVNGAIANAHPVATVTMEYHPDETNAEVQFWAFKGNGDYFLDPAATPPLVGPALDVEGNKSMPDICTGCHQGSYDPTSKLVKYGSKFLPFDVESFLDENGNPFTAASVGTGSNPTQEDFRQLNEFAMRASGPPGSPSTAVQGLMKLWYGNGNVSTTAITAGTSYQFGQGAAQLGGFTHADLYDTIVKSECRTCHIARSPGSDTWDTEAEMSSLKISIQDQVCGDITGSQTHYHHMPHAQVPYKRFWQNGSNTTLANDLSLSSCLP